MPNGHGSSDVAALGLRAILLVFPEVAVIGLPHRGCRGGMRRHEHRADALGSF